MTHSGVRSSVKLLTCRFIWSDIYQVIKKWAKSGIACRKNKMTGHTEYAIGQFPNTYGRFKVVHIDLIGPLPPSYEFIYCLRHFDRISNWTEVIPLYDVRTDTVAQAFYTSCNTRFGARNQILIDQGAQFQSELFRALAKICGSKLTHVRVCHTQSNGKIDSVEH
ncbi:uncharacterized protein LOC126195502 [Schistocerca nitens]|uniref:uncharacterized protein LOC126195502 n=1 Tax=Schistocerca nitens TaxID=7011 RepID=UPI002119945F|nr:uncharacterized protein LOC126195502 [Schistocerca nitens]